MKRLDEYFKSARKIVILGHVRPDGDCVGSCLALYHYIRTCCPDVDPEIYLGETAEDLMRILPGAERIRHELPEETDCDLCMALDVSEESRLGEFLPLFRSAAHTVCIDHHVTNPGFAEENMVDPKAAATAELLYTLMEESRISRETAVCLYTGMVHDTGVFKHSNTTRRTMEAAGALLEKGVRSNEIIDGTFFHKSFVQNKLLGKALMNAELEFGGELICSVLRLSEIEEQNGTSLDLEGIVDQLRVTDGTRCAAFVHETEPGIYRVSLRGGRDLDVSRIAAVFGGGGHVKAAGCTIEGDSESVKGKLCSAVFEELCRNSQE